MHLALHIGPFKTGSTLIQKSLDAGFDALLEQGCFYFPSSQKLREQALSTRFVLREEGMTLSLRRSYPTLEAAQAWSESRWQKFEAEALRRAPRLTLISSEHFAGLNKPGLLIERLRKTFERITVIAYVREPVDLYCSSIQQRTRGGQRFAQLQSPLSYGYPAQGQLKRYMDLVGRENMIVRKFSSTNLLNKDVVQDFLATLSGLGQPVTIPSLRANEAFPAAAMAWLLTVNEVQEKAKDTDVRRALLRRLKRSPEVQALPRLKLGDSPDLVAAINGNARPACDWINETFLDGQELLKAEDGGGGTPPKHEWQARHQLRDLLLSYLTPEAMTAIAQAALVMKTKKD